MSKTLTVPIPNGEWDETKYIITLLCWFSLSMYVVMWDSSNKIATMYVISNINQGAAQN